MNYFGLLYPSLFSIMGVAALRMGWDREAGILVASAVVLLVVVAWSDLWERAAADKLSQSHLNEARAKFANSIVNLSPEDKQILGIEWPELDIEFNGKPTICLRGTNILLACFQKFIEDSTDTDFASERLYNDDKFLQQVMGMSRDAVRHQWHLTVAYLADPTRGFLTKNSAAGNHSYKWMKNGRKRMLQWYGAVRAENYVNMEEVTG